MNYNPDIVFYKDRAAELTAALKGENVKITPSDLGVTIVKTDENGVVKKDTPIFQTIIRKVDKYCKSHELSFMCGMDFAHDTPCLFIF